MASRPWLVLAVLALVGGGIWVLVRRPPEKPAPLAAVPATPVLRVPAAPAGEPPARPSRRPHIRPGRAPMDRDIVATVRDNQSGVRSCYERALKRDHGLTARLEVEVSVLPTGTVERVGVGGASAAPELTSCIRTTIKGWKFPHAPQPYSTAFPLRLQQGG
jgi:outer membrane biosynthesis protein TonB